MFFYNYQTLKTHEIMHTNGKIPTRGHYRFSCELPIYFKINLGKKLKDRILIPCNMKFVAKHWLRVHMKRDHHPKDQEKEK